MEKAGIEACPNVDDKFAFAYGRTGEIENKDRVPEAPFRFLQVWNVATWKSIILFRSRNIVKREGSPTREN